MKVKWALYTSIFTSLIFSVLFFTHKEFIYKLSPITASIISLTLYVLPVAVLTVFYDRDTQIG
jgi:hypothetical protein